MAKICEKLKSLWARSAARWLCACVCAALCGVGLAYYWRVFYSFTALPAPVLTLGLAGAGAAAVGLAFLASRIARTFPARAALAVFLCGACFCFGNPPLQVPDETSHFLRAYAVSMGRFDFDAGRGYPADVDALMAAFPGAWVNGNTSFWTTADDAGNITGGGSSRNYAIKEDAAGVRTGVAQGFSLYMSRREGGAPAVHEPLIKQILPYLPAGLAMAAARLLGLGALGCMYAGRLANLAVYAFLCFLALRNCRRYATVFLAVMLLPLSLYVAASLNYDALMLGCYYLAASYYCADRIRDRDLAVFLAAFILMNAVKPWINLLWVVLPLILPARVWEARFKKWQVALAVLAGALAVTAAVELYGGAFAMNYEDGRMLGSTVSMSGQLSFVLAHLPRTLMVFIGSLYENGLYLGQLGLFGSLDLSLPVVQLLSVCTLLLGAALAVHEKSSLTPRSAAGLAGLAVFYTGGVLAAQYITYTPVGMVRVLGVQARYLLPAFLMLFVLLAALLSRVLEPTLPGHEKARALGLRACAFSAVVCALLLAQHYFVGPVCMVP